MVFGESPWCEFQAYYEPRTAVIRVGVTALAVLSALCLSSVQSDASAHDSVGTNEALVARGSIGAATCAFNKLGKPIGCVPSCENLFITRRGSRLFLHEQPFPKDVELPEPDTAGERLRLGVWRIVTWPNRRFLGRAAAANAAKTRWRITNSRGSLAATVRGPNGPHLALVLLSRGRDYLC